MSNNTTEQQLLEMGFGLDQVREALALCNGNAEHAVEFLFGGGSAATRSSNSSSITTPSSSRASAAKTVTANSSQYSFDQGRSACTCIALTAAESLLSAASNNISDNNSNMSDILTAEWIDSVLQQGVQTYHQQRQASHVNTNVEHSSAEEWLAHDGVFTRLQLLPGGVRQGVLGADASMGLRTVLSACQSDQHYLALLITKTPETVVVFLPPSSHNGNDNAGAAPFGIFDSHPRPAQGLRGAYGQWYESLDGLVQHLSTIFPATDLGPDIPELMAVMYNSFDVYPLRLASSDEQRAS